MDVLVKTVNCSEYMKPGINLESNEIFFFQKPSCRFKIKLIRIEFISLH